LLFTRMGGIWAITSSTVRSLGVSKFYEINTGLTMCQLIWTALG
jgi:hypothetical protein